MPRPRRLFVLRHAKSSWEDPGLDDHDRPLAPRGRRAAAAIAEHLRATDTHPTLVLCSTARRTRETLEAVAPGGEVSLEPQLYEASAGTILERLRVVPDATDSVMIIGHNPAVQILVMRLAGGAANSSDGSPLEAVRRKFPTGALATLAFEGSWADLAPGGAELLAFVRPKELRSP